MNDKTLESFHLFCVQPFGHFKTGVLEMNSKGQYAVDDHVLSEGEIVSILIDGTFIEVSLHLYFQNLYAIGAPIELGDTIKYEPCTEKKTLCTENLKRVNKSVG